MNSNEQPAPYVRWSQPPSRPTPRPYSQAPEWSPGPPKPHVIENALRSGQVQIERKNFIFSLKENPRGRLLRITEDVGGRYNSIIIPATGLHEFMKLLDEMIKATDELTPEQKPLDNEDSALGKIKGETQTIPKPPTKPDENYEQGAGLAVDPLEGPAVDQSKQPIVEALSDVAGKKTAEKTKAKPKQRAPKASVGSLAKPSKKVKQATTKEKLRKTVARPKRRLKAVK
ncbi:MAG TPA: hypothetical protein VG347_06070 [Verrucomicrobiae bacterium]|nr:hypothetical protein [Verrucomicrobiae bacterium]